MFLSHACDVSCRARAGKCPATVLPWCCWEAGGFAPSRSMTGGGTCGSPTPAPVCLGGSSRPGRTRRSPGRLGLSTVLQGDRRPEDTQNRPRPRAWEAAGITPVTCSPELATPVDVQRLTGDERCLVAAQERGRRRDVLGLPDAP